jgi:predicted dienelactone hydrolase
MRIFETLFLVLFLFSIISLLFKKQKSGLYACTLAVFTGVASMLAEVYRIQIVPAFSLAVILLATDLLKKYKPGIKINRLIKRLCLILFIPLAVLAIALPLLFPVVQLPVPTGSYPVGTTRMSFVDLSREEIFTQQADNRNVPVQIWYPAANTDGKQVARWISSVEAMGLFTKYRNLPDLFGYFTLVKTHSYLNAVVSDAEEKYPVILFSGGGAMFNGQNVIQMEELASQGYIVFAVGHPYEDFTCIYPDGSIVPYSEKQKEELSADTAKAVEIAKRTVTDTESGDFHKAILRNAVINNDSVRIWSQDMGFIADKILEMNDSSEESIFAGKLDVSNIGAFGHSFGGAASGQLCLEDERIKAFINMDGSPFGDAPNRELDQPFMILTHGGDEKYSIQTGYSDSEKGYTMVQIMGAKHMNFSDLNSLIPAVGRLSGFLGNIQKERQIEIMNHYILDFFDMYLKGKPSALLDAPTSIYPEVTVVKQ